MKLAIILCLIGAALATPSTPQALECETAIEEDLRAALCRLLTNVDGVELDRVIREIFETDQGMLIILILRGSAFGRILDFIEAEVEVNNIIDYIGSHGLPGTRDAIAKLWADLGVPRPTSAPREIGVDATFEELLQQLAGTINQAGLIETLLDVINNDMPTVYLFEYISREEVRLTWERIKAQEDLVTFLNVLNGAGIPVDLVIAFIEGLLGWDK